MFKKFIYIQIKDLRGYKLVGAAKRSELKICSTWQRRNHPGHCELFTSHNKREQFHKEIKKKMRDLLRV